MQGLHQLLGSQQRQKVKSSVSIAQANPSPFASKISRSKVKISEETRPQRQWIKEQQQHPLECTKAS
jgi:hypothetical protein